MPVNLSLIFKALDFAARKHRDQRRKDEDATPYINHPIEVAELLVNEACIDDANILAAAILHDTLEDTEATEQELQNVFGEIIAAIVLEVSDNKSLTKQERKRQQIEHAGSSSDGAKLIKLADKICNLRDVLVRPPANWDIQRKQEYFDWAREVIDRVRGIHPDLEKSFDVEYSKRPL